MRGLENLRNNKLNSRVRLQRISYSLGKVKSGYRRENLSMLRVKLVVIESTLNLQRIYSSPGMMMEVEN